MTIRPKPIARGAKTSSPNQFVEKRSPRSNGVTPKPTIASPATTATIRYKIPCGSVFNTALLFRIRYYRGPHGSAQVLKSGLYTQNPCSEHFERSRDISPVK